MGSVLMQDDGFGPFAVRMLLARYDFPQEVMAEDLGTPGLHLTPVMESLEGVIIIDTVKAEGEVGDVRLYRRETLMRLPAGPRASPHDPGLHETLLMLDMAGRSPREFLLVGVIPGPVQAGTEISASVRTALPEVERVVLTELSRLGHKVTKRDPPAAPDLWWLGSTQEGEA